MTDTALRLATAEAYLADATVRVGAAVTLLEMGDVDKARVLLGVWIEDERNRRVHE